MTEPLLATWVLALLMALFGCILMIVAFWLLGWLS